MNSMQSMLVDRGDRQMSSEASNKQVRKAESSLEKDRGFVIELTHVKSIRAKCLDCTCQQTRAVRMCLRECCALWNYHKGVSSGHSSAIQVNEASLREKLRSKLGISAPELTLLNKRRKKE